jgi:tellurite resistance protein TehA-like permease
MGTGITSILLYNFPYPAQWLRTIGTIIFVLNIAVFCLLAMGNMARYTIYKGVFGATVKHTLAGMFWGTLPMGFATIVVSSSV